MSTQQETTLAIIKPDAVLRGLTGAILHRIEASHFSLQAAKLITLSTDEMSKFYAIHSDKSFFEEMVDKMVRGPIFVMVLRAPYAVSRFRTFIGETDPAKAQEGTLRQAFGIDITENSIHGSDSIENALQEIAFFFPEQ